MKNIIYFIVLSLFSLPSFAAPYLAEPVKEFINSTGTHANAKMTVLVTYHLSQQPSSSVQISRAERQRFLVSEVQNQEARVFQQDLKVAPLDKTTLWIVNGTAVTLTQRQLKIAAQNKNLVSILAFNRAAEIIPSTESVGVLTENYTYGLERLQIPELRKQFPNIDGRGVRVGIIDTGADPNHPDLKDKIKVFKDFIDKKTVSYDDQGHGTHVAGTIAGGSESGKSIGVAPAAELIIAKAFNRYGSSSEAALVGAMQWVVDPDGNPATDDYPHVVSNSWGLGQGYEKSNPQDEPFCTALENARKLGVVMVFAAGNSGPSKESVSLPGACPQSLTVGATDEKDTVAQFSSRGPSQWLQDSFIKPDISAPGVNVYSARTGGGYTYKSGTSMATPHIAGVMALLINAAPNATIEEREKAILSTAQDFGSKGPDNLYGAGRANALEGTRYLMRSMAR